MDVLYGDESELFPAGRGEEGCVRVEVGGWYGWMIEAGF